MGCTSMLSRLNGGSSDRCEQKLRDVLANRRNNNGKSALVLARKSMSSHVAGYLKALKIAGISFIALLAYLFFSVVSVSTAAEKSQPGQSGLIFDKAFLQSIKNVLLYERIVRIVGVPAVKVGADSHKIPGEKYHWSGRGNSSFNLRVISGKVIEANVVTPEGHIVSMESNGELFEISK